MTTTQPKAPRVFFLVRLADETGVSGTGIVADGVQFQDGSCALCWATEHTSVAVYRSIDDVQAIHGHGGKTVIAWGGIDFVHLPTRTLALHDGVVVQPLADGTTILVDGWPRPDEHYMPIGKYVNAFGRELVSTRRTPGGPL